MRQIAHNAQKIYRSKHSDNHLNILNQKVNIYRHTTGPGIWHTFRFAI